jgi:hypothetical protein
MSSLDTLRSFEAMLGYVRRTTTETGLEVKATLVDEKHTKGIKVSDIEVAVLVIYSRSFLREPPADSDADA